MIGWERRVLLRHYLDQGLTVTEMARELETSRQTVYRWVRSGELDRDVEDVRYGPRPSVPTKLDPYKGILRERLDAYPELTAVRLLAEIRAAGYPGGYTQLKEYVRTVRPRPPEEPEVRFETAPGRVILYLRPQAGGIEVPVTFRARMALDAVSEPTVLYEYYDPDARVTLAPERFRIRRSRRVLRPPSAAGGSRTAPAPPPPRR